MAGRIDTIADALAAWLNDAARSWPLTGWTAAVTYDPVQLNEDLADELFVELVPPDEPAAEEAVTRGLESQDFVYLLGFRKRYDATGQVPRSFVAPLLEVVEAIADALPSTELSTGTGYQARCETAKLAPAWDADTLRNDRTFLGVIEITIREYRAR